MKLETSYFPGNLTTIDRLPEGTKRRRICQAIKPTAIKPLTEFRLLTHKGE